MSEKNCCPKCGRKLEPSDVDGYKFVCFNCDENFYGFEAVEEQERVTLSDFVNGFNKGVVKFVECPDGFDDVVCRIGDGWFYFAGMSGEMRTPAEFIEEVGIESVLTMAYWYMENELKEIDADEVTYYEAVLMELREKA